MIKYDNRKPTSKIALYFLNWIMFGICVAFIGLSTISSPNTDLTVKTHTSQSNASDSVSVEAEIRQIAQNEGFEWPDYLCRLAKCESGLNPLAVGDSGHSRGLFQIHELYWPSVSDEQAFNIEWSTKFAMNLINSGYQHYFSCDKIVRR